MVYKNPDEGRKAKPRGKPFPKGNKKGKTGGEVLDAPGRKSGVERGVVAPASHKSNPEPLKEEIEASGIEFQLPEKALETLKPILKENMDSPQAEDSKEKESEDKKDLELIDSLVFKNGENNLTIRFSKKHNRMFRIQVFLNDQSEIRPVTYTGASTGYAFWNLLKGALKK